MKEIEILAPEEKAGQRVDIFLAGEIEGMTRSGVQRLIEQGSVYLCGSPVKKNYKICGGERLTVAFSDPQPAQAEAQEIPLDIIYEDDCVIVINKPRGMVVHPAAGNPDGTVVNALLAHCGDSLSGIGGQLRPGIVHRIDKDTSGLLIVAKTDEAHRKLSEQLKDRSLSRVYHAVVYGNIRQDEGTVDAPIGRSHKDRKKMAVVPEGRAAVTYYKVLARCPGYTYVQCRLKTGRTHQIRVHMAHIGHPVAGDLVYGPKNDKTGLGGQCLHAKEISFIHPKTGERMTLCSTLPDYFRVFLKKIGMENG